MLVTLEGIDGSGKTTVAEALQESLSPETVFTREPDLTLYLDVPPETGAERAGATNKFETAGYLGRVRENYEDLVDTDPARFVRIDATRSPEAVVEAAERAIEAVR